MEFLSSIVSFSLRQRIVVLTLTLLLIIIGVKSALQLPIDAVPDVTNVQVQIITSAPALSPLEIEQYVTVPVERAMAGLPKMEEVRSISKYGISVVTLVFNDNADIYFVRQLVNERMREAESTVPKQYGRPEMGPISTGLGEILQFVVRGKDHSLMQLEETLDWFISPQIRMVPGVIETISFGGEDKQYQVVVDPRRLQAIGLSIADVAAALEKSNANAGGGYIEHNKEQYLISTSGLVKSKEDLKTVVISATTEGVPITLDNIADVQLGARLRRGAASMDGKGEVVVGVALLLKGENSRTVTEAIKSKIQKISKNLPSGMTIEPFYDRAALVNRIIHTVLKNLLEGAALVIVILLILLGDVRAGLIVATTIPLSMLFAIILMNAFGLSGNLMSLGAIDFGLIVDGSVIIIENTLRRLSEAQHKTNQPLSGIARSEVVKNAAIEVRSASVFGEAIIAIVYLPILALRGIEGKLFQPMALTVLLALLGAFILSLTLIPVLASYFLKAASHHDTWLMRQIHHAYLPTLGKALKHPVKVIGAGAFLLACSVTIFLFLGSEFVPQLDEGDILVEARRLPGIALSESIATDQRMQKAILTIPEVEHVVSKTGSPELAMDPMGVEQTDVYIQLKPRPHWRPGLTKEQLGNEISEVLEKEVPEVAGAISQPIQMRTNELIAGVRSDVAVQIYGQNLQILEKTGEQIANILAKIEGAKDIRSQHNSGLPYLKIYPHRAKLARYGLSIEDVNQLTETLAVGHHVGQIFEGDRRFELTVKIAHGFNGSLAQIGAMPLKAKTGQMVPLAEVADIQIEKGPAIVNREKISRRHTVEFNVRDRDIVSVVKDAQALIDKEIKLPENYRLEWGGQFQNFIEAKNRLLWVVPLALMLIFFMLWMAFYSVKSALFIFLNIPFATIGGIFALLIRGIPFSISAGVGFIALFGVAVLNGLVLLSFCKHLEERGVTPQEAIRQAAEMRLRPVVMTALVAALGFLPMALSSAPGSEVQRPLATVVIGGLVSATALTLFLLPVMYQMFHRPRTLTQTQHG